jgi:hypothetical protein
LPVQLLIEPFNQQSEFSNQKFQAFFRGR